MLFTFKVQLIIITLSNSLSHPIEMLLFVNIQEKFLKMRLQYSICHLSKVYKAPFKFYGIVNPPAE